jgi:hypothetical protein
MSIKNWILGAAAAASVMAAVPAAAVSTIFAQVVPVGTARNFLWARTSPTGGTFYTTSTANGGAPGVTSVVFSLVGSPVPLSVTANLLLSGSTANDPLGVSSGPFSQQIDSLVFNITATTAFCWGPNCFNVGDSLLSGSVSNADITGVLGTRVASLNGNTTTGATISYASPLVTFDPGSDVSFDFGLTGLDRNLSANPQNSLGSFRGTIGGTFSSDPDVTFNVPEPGTWALMIVGMGLVGLARRRRRAVVAA